MSTELKNWTGASPALHPVGELLDRHWEAAFAYARLCTDSERAAGMLTTAAFTRLFGESLRQDGPTAAWRPHLLVTVRRIAAEWDADGRRPLLHADLRAAAGDGERLAARLLPPVHRRTLSRAFQRLPQSARCLLWHIEVEGEPPAVPAALLGLDTEGARIELRRARERLREECLQVHRELAVDDECHRYHRLLDVTCRRGGPDVDPDLRAHLAQCRHCAHTADQLRRFPAGLGLALAEGVLGWAATAYAEGRRSRPEDVPAPATTAPTPSSVTPPAAATTPGTDRPPVTLTDPPGTATLPATASRCTSRRAALRAARRARRRNLAAAVLTVGALIVLPLVVWSARGGDDGSDAAPVGDAAERPNAESGTASSGPSWAGTSEKGGTPPRGRLRNAASGLCLDVTGARAAEGAESVLATCSAAATQQWSYEADGLLRSGADPDLCLDSSPGFSVRLAPCADADRPGGKNIRYDFTLQGVLVPRWDQNLALAPAATDGSGTLVTKNRAGIPAQRWIVDTSRTAPQMQTVNWGAGSAPATTPAPTTVRGTAPDPRPSRTTTAPAPTSSPAPTATPSCPYDDPYACSGDGGYSGGYGYGYGWGGHDPGPGGGRR